MEDVPSVTTFESEFADLVAARHAIVLTSPATALRLALQLVGVADGSSVVLPASFWSSGVPVVTGLGGQAVLADVEATSGTLSPSAVARVLTARTCAVVVDDTEGIPADIDALRDVASRVGASLVEHVGRAAGALYKGGPVGGHSDVAIWSLKDGPLGIGDGAVLTTDRDDWAAYVRVLRRPPLPAARELEVTLQRAYGMYQATFARRNAIERLRHELSGLNGIRLVGEDLVGSSSGWTVGLEVLDGGVAERDALADALGANGVHAFAGWGSSGAAPADATATPVAVRLQERVVRVPIESVDSPDGRAAVLGVLSRRARGMQDAHHASRGR